MQLESLEVADQDVSRALVLWQDIEIFPGLLVGFVQIASGALLLDDENTRPEQVDEPRAVVQLRDTLLVAGNASPLDPEYLKEVVVETLRFSLLVARLAPLSCKGSGAGTDLVPGQAHQFEPTARTS